MRLTISRRLIRKLPKILFKSIPTIDGLPLVTPLRYLGLVVEDDLLLHAFNFVTVPLECTQIWKEEVRQLLKQLDMHSEVHLP